MDNTPIIQSYIGMSGSGKSYLALKHLSAYSRQIRFDAQPYGQSALQDGCQIIRDIDALNIAVKKSQGGPFKICFWPRHITLKTAFHWVCKIAITYENIAIFADEANRYIDRHLCNASEAVFFQSRHSRTRLFYTMFNPRTISPEMRGNTVKVHLFQSYEENVLSYLKSAGADEGLMARFTSENLPKYSYALIEAGKRPRIISPKGVNSQPKDSKKPIKPLVKKAAKGGRRAKK